MPRGQYDRSKAKKRGKAAEGGEAKSPIESPSTESPIETPTETPSEPAKVPIELLSQKYKLPRGICKCGHSGDGPLSDHADIDKGAGMGECGSIDCECKAFFFERYTDFFANKGLKTPAALEAINDTIKKLKAQAVSEGREKWAEAGEASDDGKGENGKSPTGPVPSSLGDGDTQVVKTSADGSGQNRGNPIAEASPHDKRRTELPAPEKPDAEPSGDGKGGDGNAGQAREMVKAVAPDDTGKATPTLPAPETPEGKYLGDGVCEYCGWPLKTDPKDGCTKDNCSMRPRPPKRSKTPDAKTPIETALVKTFQSVINSAPKLEPINSLCDVCPTPLIEGSLRMNPLDEAIKALTSKGFKVIPPKESRRPVYDLSFDPDKPERATMVITLTTKERVIIELFPPTDIGELNLVPESYVFFSNFENGISLKDAIRISRGIRKLAGVLKG